MNTVNTEREKQLDAERATQNYTHYSDSENREHTAAALERIAGSLERIADSLEKPITIELDESSQRALDELATDFYEFIH